MRGRRSKRVLPTVLDQLEARLLLAGGQLPGNEGAIISSQYQPAGFVTKVGTQLRDVTLGGPLNIDVLTPPFASETGGVGLAPYPINTGLIALSQFNNQGFRTVGAQLDNVAVGGGLTIAGTDNEDASGGQSINPLTVTNANLIANSQFNDGGFGIFAAVPGVGKVEFHSRVGIQWRNVGIGGSVGVGLDDDIIRPGSAATPDAAPAASAATPDAVPAATTSTAVGGAPGQKIIDFTTNTGDITNSQVNDGGFGDIGFQWSNVGVGKSVGTSSNTLFINPQLPHPGPITVTNRTFGANLTSTATAASATAATATPAAQAASSSAQPAAVASTSALPPGFETTYDNSATNSGNINNAQFNDGGFGDIGLQWNDVRVKGSVSAVHNSLTVQPNNKGQGLITVAGIQFPSVASTPAAPNGALTPVPDDPAVVASDGQLTSPLPASTAATSPYYPVPFSSAGTFAFPFPGNYPLENAATNSGIIQNGQFNAGGFGDQGLQWQKVEVGGNVNLIHNSLSVHPTGSQLAGINVSNVAYGAPVSAKLQRSLANLRYLVVTPADNTSQYGAYRPAGDTLKPPNDRIITNQQLAVTGGTDVVLQWNGIEHNRGLILVNNVIKIQGVGPMTGPIILSNIRFPGSVPNVRPTVTVVPDSSTTTSTSTQSTAASTTAAATTATPAADAVGIEPRNAVLLNDSNNSGTVDGAQVATGGFGDDGLQWNNVAVAGSVNVVHNQLAIDESSDLQDNDVPGPILVSNVSFNSGTLEGNISNKSNQIVVAPPRVFEAKSTHKTDPGVPLPQDPTVRQDTTNSGVIKGGQVAAGAANHILLQWQCVKVGGSVTVMDNVLTISMQNKPTGPVVISNVTFA